MERIQLLADLGQALAQLRSLQGLSLEMSAARLGMTAERLAAAEAGDLDDAVMESIARYYALDEDDLREGMIRPLEAVESATVFLLHGAYQDFDAQDLGVLDRAMRAARAMTALAASSGDREVLGRRLQFVPVGVAGPKPVDAARQGHKLARKVRAHLGLGGEPVGDLRELLEEHFGIAVIVDDLVSEDLRAASILAAHRAAAAAILASGHPDMKSNPTLARVYLAHELGHLLFDPAAPGSIRIGLDDGRTSDSGAPRDESALLESRAKGFAAELLIPLEGLVPLLGSPSAPVSLEKAKEMVTRVREHFGTPWDIAIYHLHNLGYIQKELKLALKSRKKTASSVPHVTTLPSTGATSRRLEALLLAQASTNAAERIEVEALSRSAVDVSAAPWYVDAAEKVSSATISDLTETGRVIERALEALERKRELKAGDLLVEHLDDLFLAGKFAIAGGMLSRLDPERLPPKVLSGVLMVSKHAQSELGPARVDFFNRVRSALLEKWELPREQIEALERRLA